MRLALLWTAALCVLAVSRADELPPKLRDVGIDQHLNQRIPLDDTFFDEQGQAVTLRRYFGSRPAVLVLGYYQCPMLCTVVLEGLATSLRNVRLHAGTDFDVIAVSIDPQETPSMAASRKREYLSKHKSIGTAQAWHFLTGSEPAIEGLSRATGFRYSYDPASGQFAHASAVMVLTPDGRLARYFYGVQYPPRDLRLGIVEASAGKIGTPVDQVLLFCYHYDPATGKYGVLIWNVVRLAATVTTVLLITLLAVLFRRERRNAREPLRA